MTLSYISLASLMLVLLGNFLSGTSPMYLLSMFFRNVNDGSRRSKTQTLLTYFGGGVFMSICLLNLQPEANREYEKHFHHCPNHRRLNTSVLGYKSEKESHEEGFSIPDFIILCSFLTLFAVEEILQLISSSLEKNTTEDTRKVPFCSCAKRHTECSRTFKANDPTEQTLYGLEKHPLESNKDTGQPEHTTLPRPSDAAGETERRLLQTSIISQAVPNYGAVTNIAQLQANQHMPILATPIILDEEGKVTISPPPMNPADYKRFTAYLLLAIVLSIYNIYQGISIGYIRDSFSCNLIIQCINQFIISFVAGITISQDSETLPVVCYVGLLSLMCPLGISMTMIFDDALMKMTHLARAIISATLCGNILYLTFFDLLRGNTMHSTPSLAKFVFFTSGAALIAILRYISVFS